jgi:hypothetical protein
MAEGYLAAMFAALEDDCTCEACKVLRGIAGRMKAKFTVNP